MTLMILGMFRFSSRLVGEFSAYFSELSPLCVEEFDLSDRNFRPCPCGYQVSASLSTNLPGVFTTHSPWSL